MLDGSSSTAARAGTYVVAHPDSEWISRIQQEFNDSAVGPEFKLFDLDKANNQTFGNISFDLAIVANDMSGREERLKLIPLIENLLREGGKVILCDSHHGHGDP